VILSFNEATRTALLKGGFDTFANVLVSQMLNVGMSGESYAMAGIMSIVAITVIGGFLIYTLIQSGRLERVELPITMRMADLARTPFRRSGRPKPV